MSRVNPWKITGYKAGQNVICKVSHAKPGGYAVIIPKDNLPGFLPTEQPLKAGDVLYVPPGVPHGFKDIRGFRAFLIRFDMGIQRCFKYILHLCS